MTSTFLLLSLITRIQMKDSRNLQLCSIMGLKFSGETAERLKALPAANLDNWWSPEPLWIESSEYTEANSVVCKVSSDLGLAQNGGSEVK